MTRKDFELIASTLKASAANELVVKAFANTLAHTNPRFNRDRFIEAATYVEDTQTVTIVAPTGQKADVVTKYEGSFKSNGKTVHVYKAAA